MLRDTGHSERIFEGGATNTNKDVVACLALQIIFRVVRVAAHVHARTGCPLPNNENGHSKWF